MPEERLGEGTDVGAEIRISDDVIAAIAGTAALQVQGVSGMAGSIVDDIGARLQRKSFGRGVRVSSSDHEVVLDIYLCVKYGARIPEVAYKVQENVKKSVESMTDYKVVSVNIHVQGVTFQEPAQSGRESS